jgi:hypothetical protein
MNCQATRPERAPRVVAHSSACARKLVRSNVEAKMGSIAIDHVEIVILTAFVKAEPEAEPVGQRHLFLDRFARIDGGGAFVFHHVARQQMPAVGGGVEQDVVRPCPQCRRQAPP